MSYDNEIWRKEYAEQHMRDPRRSLRKRVWRVVGKVLAWVSAFVGLGVLGGAGVLLLENTPDWAMYQAGGLGAKVKVP